MSRTSAQYMGDLRTMLAEVSKVYEGQLAAKDETIATQRAALATKDQALAADALALAALRRRAEQAEAARDRLAAQTAPAAPSAPAAPTRDTHAPDVPVGFWARVRPALGRDQ